MMNEINELSEMFNEVKDEVAVFTNVPDGVYVAQIGNVEYTQSKAGKPMVVISHEIIDGPETGRVHKQFLMLVGNDEAQTRSNLNRYATEIKKLGVDLTGTKLSDSFEQFDGLRGIKTELTLETTQTRAGKDWTNTSFELI